MSISGEFVKLPEALNVQSVSRQVVSHNKTCSH